jgi:hypothetical protein
MLLGEELPGREENVLGEENLFLEHLGEDLHGPEVQGTEKLLGPEVELRGVEAEGGGRSTTAAIPNLGIPIQNLGRVAFSFFHFSPGRFCTEGVVERNKFSISFTSVVRNAS